MIFDKFLKPGSSVMVALVGDEGLHNALGGIVAGVDSESVAIKTDGEIGRSVVIVMRSQIKAVFTSLNGER